MLTFCKVFLIVLLIAITARAADSRQPIISEHVFTVQVPDHLNHHSVQSHGAAVNATTFPSVTIPRKFSSDYIQMRPYCLTIRSMRFLRSGPDQVRFRSMTTCTSGSQFQVKRAIAPAVTP
jgi:hypothetical protein